MENDDGLRANRGVPRYFHPPVQRNHRSAQAPAVLEVKDDILAGRYLGLGHDSGGRLLDGLVAGGQRANVIFRAKDFHLCGFGLLDERSRRPRDFQAPLASRAADERHRCAGLQAAKVHPGALLGE